MKVLHIFKADHNYSSRIFNQINIDEGDVISTTSFPKLTFRNLYYQIPQYDIFVFHCQSSIIFMLFVLFFKDASKVRYDIHDLNEFNLKKGIKFNLKFFLFYFLERIIIRKIKICNVSEGNKKEYLNRGYVFFNLPKIDPLVTKIIYQPSKDFVFFGTEERCPKDLFPLAKKKAIDLSIFGMFSDNFKKIMHENNISFMGRYKPQNLDFLENYKYSIIYSPQAGQKNMQNSLPNKFFQSILYSLNICLSENFTEMISFCEKHGVKFNIIRRQEDLLNLTYYKYNIDLNKIFEENNLRYRKFIYGSLSNANV